MNLINATFELDPEPSTSDRLVQIEELVQHQLRGRLKSLRIIKRECGLVLQGRAYSFYAKQLALHSVRKATGLLVVANEIVVS